MVVSCFANAGETKNEITLEASNGFCFWVFCESQNPVPLGPGLGDPPGVDPS